MESHSEVSPVCSKRPRVESEQAGADSRMVAFKKQSKQAASASAQTIAPLSDDPVEGSSDAPFAFAKRQKLGHKSRGSDSWGGLPLPLEDVGAVSRAELLDALAQAQAEVLRQKGEASRLQDEVREKNRLCHEIELRVKQDMMLDLMKERDKIKKMQTIILKEQHRARTMEGYHRATLADLERSLAYERNKVLAATTEVKTWKLEVEHYQNLTAGLESDLEELRKLHDEDKAKQERLNTGLPPAYGSIDDSERLPPWDRHQDSGPLLISTLKRKVRSMVDKAATSTLATCAGLQCAGLGAGEISAKTQRDMALCMHECCKVINNILHYDGEFHTVRIFTATITGPLEYLESHAAAESIVDLTIDVLWRTASVAEVRPAAPMLLPYDNAQMGLHFAAADDTLLNGLQAAFEDRRSLADLQRRLTQVNALRSSFFGWGMDLRVGYFGRTLLWLSEQVEKERELAANVRDPFMRRTMDHRWENVSSVGGGSQNSSARNSVEREVRTDEVEREREALLARFDFGPMMRTPRSMPRFPLPLD